MKNFKNFQSKALSNDDLMKIKGGTTTLSCDAVYQSCLQYCGTWPNGDWYSCVANKDMSCSPLQGWDIYCA